MSSSPSASGVDEGTTRQTPFVGRRFGHATFASTLSEATSSNIASQSASQSTHDELVTRLRSALKALGGRPDATPPTSSNMFAADELEACSRRVEPVPKMQSLDTADDDRVSDVDRVEDAPPHSIEAHAVFQTELEHVKRDASVLQAEIDELITQRSALGTVEDDLRARRSELAEIETEIRVGERRLNELDWELAAKRGEIDAQAAHLDRLESLASEGERIVEDQSRKASVALKDLEWMEAELGQLSAELVEVTARLDEKSLMLRETETLVSRSKRQTEELEGQRRLLEELERHNAAALDESRRLGREIDGMQGQKQAISFSLEPALSDALEELELSKVFASNELAKERGKAEQLERALERLTTTTRRVATGVGGASNLLETTSDLVHRLECERLASVKRTSALAEGGCGWRRWRPTQTISVFRNAAAC